MIRLDREIGLPTGSADQVAERVLKICGLDHTTNLWQIRAATWVRVCIAGMFDLHAKEGTNPSFETVLGCLKFYGPMSFTDMVGAYCTGRLAGPAMIDLLNMAEILPGFRAERAISDEPQPEITSEIAEYVTMQIIPPLEKLRDEILGRSQARDGLSSRSTPGS